MMSGWSLDGALAQSIAENWFLENQSRIDAMGLQTSFERTTPDGMGPHARIVFENENIAAEALIYYEGSVALIGGAVKPMVDFIPPSSHLGSTKQKLDAILNTIAEFN